MTIIQVHKCDKCQKQIEPIDLRIGFSASATGILYINLGKSRSVPFPSGLDFCSIGCLMNFIAEMREKK